MSYMIRRSAYLSQLTDWLWKPVIKVITGIRRVGKSVLLKQFIETLSSDVCVLYIDKENIAFDDIRTYVDLHKYILEHQSDQKKNILIIDEIQSIDQREKVVTSLAAESERYDLYITWSNSTLLSSELATTLSWRYITIHIYPLQFYEFQADYQSDRTELFKQYMQQGWLPWLLALHDNISLQQDYLLGLKNTIILKDIVDRFWIRNVTQFQNILVFLADNIGNLFSAKKISDYFRSQQLSLTVMTLQDYLYYAQTTYLIYKLPRYDIKWKRLLEVNEKRYFGDIGLRNNIVWWRDRDIALVLENIVFLELLSRWYSVSVGVLWEKEIDFVATRVSGEVEYFQVCYLLKDEQTIHREFGNLQAIKDNYPKTVITMDNTPSSSHEGIRRIHIIDWLLDR